MSKQKKIDKELIIFYSKSPEVRGELSRIQEKIIQKKCSTCEFYQSVQYLDFNNLYKWIFNDFCTHYEAIREKFQDVDLETDKLHKNYLKINKGLNCRWYMER